MSDWRVSLNEAKQESRKARTHLRRAYWGLALVALGAVLQAVAVLWR